MIIVLILQIENEHLARDNYQNVQDIQFMARQNLALYNKFLFSPKTGLNRLFTAYQQTHKDRTNSGAGECAFKYHPKTGRGVFHIDNCN